MPNLRRVGADAEDRAAEFLFGKGYSIITRRYHGRFGEIDIIALDDETLVFVEVKERHAIDMPPEQAVSGKKVSKMAKAAARFRKETNDERNFRFDLIAIDKDGLRHYEGCFQPNGEES
jgi:putative endonuclease